MHSPTSYYIVIETFEMELWSDGSRCYKRIGESKVEAALNQKTFFDSVVSRVYVEIRVPQLAYYCPLLKYLD